ncbi:hypothetical protein LAZ67_6003885 [Cordylochernes scorpioides]|uniref:Integrase catalytic domain-containing protein n=1 Tax=Cordylochernes scorpioides TaxID=51811 RepID=A0ABY6KMD7_9ARAC|nr:hypothetical protein LAZ67_6003885 [Cordylochernes scorpioides]
MISGISGHFASHSYGLVEFEFTPHLNPMNFSRSNLAHLKTMPLADPDYNISAPIDILIGAELAMTLFTGESVIGDEEQLTATSSKLGWLLSGRVSSKGPKIQQDLFHIILRFRINPVAINADIAKMYRQFRISQDDSEFQRIVWRNDPNDKIRDYRLETVTYGTSCAPFLATRIIKQLALDEQITGTFSVDEGKNLVQELYGLLSAGGFELPLFLMKLTSVAKATIDKYQLGLQLGNTSHHIDLPTLWVLNLSKEKSSFYMIGQGGRPLSPGLCVTNTATFIFYKYLRGTDNVDNQELGLVCFILYRFPQNVAYRDVTESDVLLPTLRVTLKGNRTEKTARAIIDTGSQRSYILHSTAMEMEYEQSRREFFRHSLFGGSSTDVVEHEVYTIHLSDINNSYRCEFEALGQPLICGSIPPVCPRSLLEGSEELDVSDLMRDRIEVLIGADIAGRLLTDDQRRISSGLVAIRTKLGWTVMGKIPPTEVRDDISSLCVTTLLSLDLENLWKLDAIGVSDAEVEKKTQSLQAEMEEHFAHTTTRDIEGRYEVALPWVQDKERIPSNKDLAENQLRSVRRKLEEVGDMKEYGQIFEEWMKQGIIEYAREDKLDGVHYLPHRPVYKRNSQTSRIRPVFNASARKRDKAPEHLKITAEQLKSSFYVDNCLSSFQNVEETEKFVKESTELLSTACFNLRDWDSYVEKTTLHIFCDASQFAYATCIFLRIEKEDRVDIQLIQARTRVAPLKKLTIPRLELLACLIGARLAANVIQDLEFEEIPRFYWTDSTNALCWIQREDNWAAFVMNRVKEIHNLSSPESWRHIPGRLNPADLPSRGCSAESLKETRWWEGPAWLKVSQEEWPKSTIIPDLEIVYSERRKTILNTLCTTRENENLFGRYSHFLRIVRITAWIYRFFNNAKIDRRKIISEDLSTEEITKSEIILIRLIQRESFSGHEDKKLQGFKLLVDSSGILRIKTKICRREDFANFRMPILLPSDHFLVSLLIRWNHETHGHAGLQTLLGILRENYWILRTKKTVKKIINQCIRCKRFTATPATVESTSLPEDRVRDAAVFEIVGIDLTGHLILKNKKKAWIVIFTCAVYRGVHLELVTSLSMEAFLQAFRRFIARRGRPLIVYSDNGTNFKGIANALKKIDFSRLKCDPTLKNITWKFIPPGAPWGGGWWERLIGMMKQLLFRILGQTSLGYEELSTVMCDVESLMNTRPLTYLTEESEDLAPLTPSLFLHEVREVGVPDLDLIDNQTLSRKYQYIKRVREDLRERFRIEYFGFLRQETRRLKTTIPLKVGDMVLIGQESLKRLHWPLARIIQLYPGKDGLVRVAKVKTSSGDKIRPIQKLYNLEITPEIRCRDPLTERSPTQEVRLTTEEDPLTSQQEQHHIDTPNVVSSYGRPIKRPNRLDLLNFSFPCLSRRDANSKVGEMLEKKTSEAANGRPAEAATGMQRQK